MNYVYRTADSVLNISVVVFFLLFFNVLPASVWVSNSLFSSLNKCSLLSCNEMAERMQLQIEKEKKSSFIKFRQ